MNITFITAQIFGVLASLCLIGASKAKKKFEFLSFNIASYVLFIFNLTLLKAYSGALNSLFPMILTIMCAIKGNDKISKNMVRLFSVSVCLGGMATYTDIYSLLPTIASYIYIMTVISPNMERIRSLTIVSRILWAIYDFIFMNYLTFVFDVITLLSAIIAAWRFDYVPKIKEFIISKEIKQIS